MQRSFFSRSLRAAFNWPAETILLSFRNGIFAVRDKSGAFHADRRLEPLYRERFHRVFNFYEGDVAGVVSKEDLSFHIHRNGQAAYGRRFGWVGNFLKTPDGPQAPVRSANADQYFVINIRGEVEGGPFRYVGDPNSEGQRVVWTEEDSTPVIVDKDFRPWCKETAETSKWIEACVPHKGLAVVRDRDGFFFVNQEGRDVGKGRRYMTAEPHYNGQARVRLFDGRWAVIDEEGRQLVDLGESSLSASTELEAISKAYWSSFSLKHILDSDLLRKRCQRGGGAEVPLRSDKKGLENQEMGSLAAAGQAEAVLLETAAELGLCRSADSSERLQSPLSSANFLPDVTLPSPSVKELSKRGEAGGSPKRLELSTRGRLLTSPCDETGGHSEIADRCQYWLQDRFLIPWMRGMRGPSGEGAGVFEGNAREKDTFASIAKDPKAVSLSQRVLSSYASEDWKGIAEYLPLKKKNVEGGRGEDPAKPLYAGNEDQMTIVDLGGGQGVLLREIETALRESVRETGDSICPPRLICVERPEVVAQATEGGGGACRGPGEVSCVEFQEGDLFSGPLPPADLYLLSRVLHDWPTDRCVELLKRVREEAPKESRLVVVDRVNDPERHRHAFLSLHMNLIQNALERTQTEWEDLFKSSGWFLEKHRDFNRHVIFALSKQHAHTQTQTSEDTPQLPVFQSTPSQTNTNSAGEVRKAVIPIAGRGTRLGLQSAATPKALLPLAVRTQTETDLKEGGCGGSLKGTTPEQVSLIPSLSLLLKQLDNAGGGCIEKVCIVASEEQISAVESLVKNMKRGFDNKKGQGGGDGTAGLRAEVSIVVQESPEGSGDAVLRAKEFVGDEPFVLALGDHVFSSGCVESLLLAWRRLHLSGSVREAGSECGLVDGKMRGVSLCGVRVCERDEVERTGLLRAHSDPVGSGAKELKSRLHAFSMMPWRVAETAEKPAEGSETTTRFAIRGLGGLQGDSLFYSQLGVDIFCPRVFEFLENEKKARERGIEEDNQRVGRGPILPSELCIREVVQRSLVAQGSLFACLIDGAGLDIGTPSAYVGALRTVLNASAAFSVERNELASVCSSERVKVTGEQMLEALRGLQSLSFNGSCHPPSAVAALLSAASEKMTEGSFGVHIASAPGRMDLMGGFADYSGSAALQAQTVERTFVLATAFRSPGPPRVHLRAVQAKDVGAFVRGDSACLSGLAVRDCEFPSHGTLFSNGGRLSSSAELKEGLRLALPSPPTSEKEGGCDPPSAKWAFYLTGMLHSVMKEKQRRVGGTVDFSKLSFALVSVSDLPWNSGLASSASVEVATAMAVQRALQAVSRDHISSSLSLSTDRIAQLCQQVEHDVLGAKCGLMDHLAVLHTNHPIDTLPGNVHLNPQGQPQTGLVSMVCREPLSSPPSEGVFLPPGLTTIAVESGVTRSVATSPYGTVRTAAAVGRDLIIASLRENLQHLTDLSPSAFAQMAGELPIRLSGEELAERYSQLLSQKTLSALRPETLYPVRASTEHPIQENFRVNSFSSLLQTLNLTAADPKRGQSNRGGRAVPSLEERVFGQLGELMRQAHVSYGRCGLGSSATDDLVRMLTEGGEGRLAGVVGAKVSGGGSGGSVVALVKVPEGSSPFPSPEQRGRLDGLGALFRERRGGSESAGIVRWAVPGNAGALSHGCVSGMTALGCPSVSSAVGSQKRLFSSCVSKGGCRKRGGLEGLSGNSQDEKGKEKVSSPGCWTPSVLVVNHGLPPDFNGGSEVYAETLAVQLQKSGLCSRVALFAREQDPFRPDFVLRKAKDNEVKAGKGIEKYLINFPREAPYYRFKAVPVEEAFRSVVRETKPDIVHFHHLNHLSLGLPKVAKEEGASVVKTLHDFFVLCPRGQFVVTGPTLREGQEPWRECGGQEDKKCARECIGSRYETGLEDSSLLSMPDSTLSSEEQYWTQWVGRRMAAMREACRHIDMFLAPSRHLMSTFSEKSSIPPEKLRHMPYGLDLTRVEGRQRDRPAVSPESPFVFAYIGRHQASKGVNLLVDAALNLLQEDGASKYGDAPGFRVKIFGRHETHAYTVHSPAEEGLNNLEGPLSGVVSAEQTEGEGISESPRTETETDAEAAPPPLEVLPALYRVTFDTNPDDCNFSCTMCEQHSEYSPFQKERMEKGIRRRRMDFQIIEKVVTELASRGLKEIIPTTMGEPLMYKELPKVIDLCKEKGIKMNLTTNGSFYGKGVDWWAPLIVPVGSDVKVSWNGISQVTQEKIMKNSRLDRQKANLERLVFHRDEEAKRGGNYCGIALQLTFMETNLPEIPDLVRFAIESGCDRVKGHHLWAHFAEMQDENLRRSEESILRWNAVARECREIAASVPRWRSQEREGVGEPFIKLVNFYDLSTSAAAGPEGRPAEIHPEAVCPFLGREAWVNFGGRFDPCCAPDHLRKSLGDFGKVGGEGGKSVLEVWESPEYRDLVRGYHQRELCKGCNMRVPPGTRV
uniref:Radical SAM core domain-containing protein n=1 Tax=Chromera velia CCMP2878 TaxID=1169474 RepID=A0A0G4HXI9_9ALVE|eukprot:Cvel_1502.t1-p1 / transcript=Cvel_1502.t1 / gene=Cvel_1502 / organism=Chromera_velia_CCMP2878 / gene_product=L-arabinokinase, putative / transcript_product=L-arabinokinase, putative / location=Cvel_scaffold52:137359-147007(+) / protein_length=2458 / sequence_SO=supercontig / SO=protein_coding / is_pseudo=false